MYNQLPLHIEPFSLAQQGAKFAGTIAVKRLERLRDLLSSQTGEVKVKLEIGREESVYIRGHIEADLELVCQRCGKPLRYGINVDLKLSPVLTDSQAAQVPEDCEPWVTHNEPVSVLELVEEELLLGLPMIAKHKPEECPVDFPLAEK